MLYATKRCPIIRAKEFIAGTTANPLVVGHNDTTNSDKRIFASDGNVTMQGYVSRFSCYLPW